MIKKHYYSWADVEKMCVSIVNQMYTDNWRPDYIVGITRGGNVPATIISNMTGIRCEALKVSLRDADNDSESNCWMAEDAFGYVSSESRNDDHIHDHRLRKAIRELNDDVVVNTNNRKKILIVDDINDTGATFQWIQKDWKAGCLPDSHDWNSVWNNNVRFAVMTENLSSNFELVKYHWDEVNKAEENVWLVYPYE